LAQEFETQRTRRTHKQNTEKTLGHRSERVHTGLESVEIGRAIPLSGVSSATITIAGRVLINGATSVVTLCDLTVNGSDPAVAGCFVEAIDVEGGARMVGSNIVVVNGDGDACLLFKDGFEDGTTGAWANTTP
jgi:hypothetical protein